MLLSTLFQQCFCQIASWSFLFQLCCKHFFQETVGKEKFPTISACLAALLNCWVSACCFFFFGASFLRLRLPSFWKLVAVVCFMLILPELFQFTRIQANRVVAQSDERRRLIKAVHTYVHIVWSSPESAFTPEWSPVTHPDSSPLTVVCSRFLLSRLKVSTVNCCAAHSIFCLFPKGNRSLSFSLLSFSLLDRDQ